MAELEFSSVSKVYKSGGKEVLAVDDFSLQVGDGEIVGLLGSSGCGKTTTLRAVAGFVELTAGSISMAGRDIHLLPPAERRVTMAFEGYALYPPLRVRENIGFALLREKVPRAQIDKAVNEIASLLEIEDILDSYPAAISAGQQQRTSLARALIRSAPVTLLDEPMSQLEPRLRTLIRARVKEYLARSKRTTIFVTHDQNEAITLADRIAVMEGGRLQQFDAATVLRDRPSNLFVAGFIGEPPMNIMSARIQGSGTQLSLELLHEGGKAGSIPTRSANGSLPEQLRLGIRPHRLALGADGPLEGKVISNQWLGDQAHMLLDINGLRLVAVMTENRPDWKPGSSVGVDLPDDALLFFDSKSGEALSR